MIALHRRLSARGAWAAAAATALLCLPPGRALASPCDVAAALSELGADQRGALARVCAGEAAEEPELQAAIRRAVALEGWRGAALAPLLAPMRATGARVVRAEASAPAPDLARAQASLAARPEALAGPICADLRRAVDAFVADAQVGEAAATPFLHDDPALARCLGIDGAALQDVRLVTLRADNVAELFVAAAAPGFASLTWLGSGDALVFGRHRFFVVAAPVDAPLTAVARRVHADAPAVWHGIVSHDEVAWAEPPPLTCINLDVDLGPTAELFVDGAPIPRDDAGVSRIVAVTREAHELVVVECPAAGRCHVRHREAIAAATLQRRLHDCLPLRLDLRPRRRPTVAVLDVTAGEGCREAPLGADGLRQGAADHLSLGSPRKSHEFRDLAAFAAATDALAALRGRLNPAAGAATGAETGADGIELLGSAAKEAWRQGIDVLLSFELHCVREGDEWAYRLDATRIALSSIFGRGRHGGEALDLRAFIEGTAEDFRGPDRLPIALASVIDRSLEIPYLRLLAPRTQSPYRGSTDLEIKHYGGPPCAGEGCAASEAEVVARRLSLGGPPPALCRDLEATRERTEEALDRARQALTAGDGARTIWTSAKAPARAGAQARESRAQLRGALPGWTLVVARWRGAERVADAICVELTASSREVWGDLALSIGGLHIAPSSAPDRIHIRTRIGYTHYLRPIVGVGVVVGHAHTSYQWSEGRPAWQDLGVPGEEPLRWRREALLIGGLVEVRTRHPRMPFDLRLRAAPMLSVGVLGLRDVPDELREFRAEEGGASTQLDVDLDVHIDAIVGYDIGRVAVQHLILLGFHAVNDPLRLPPNDVRENGGFFIGFGLGLGGAP